MDLMLWVKFPSTRLTFLSKNQKNQSSDVIIHIFFTLGISLKYFYDRIALF